MGQSPGQGPARSGAEAGWAARQSCARMKAREPGTWRPQALVSDTMPAQGAEPSFPVTCGELAGRADFLRVCITGKLEELKIWWASCL